LSEFVLIWSGFGGDEDDWRIKVSCWNYDWRKLMGGFWKSVPTFGDYTSGRGEGPGAGDGVCRLPSILSGSIQGNGHMSPISNSHPYNPRIRPRRPSLSSLFFLFLISVGLLSRETCRDWSTGLDLSKPCLNSQHGKLIGFS